MTVVTFVFVTTALKVFFSLACSVPEVGAMEIDTAATVACARVEKVIRARAVASDLGLNDKGYFLR